MKVARIVSELDFGGVEKVLAYSLPALQKIPELELTVVVLGKGGKVSEELEAEGIRIRILNFNPRIPNFKLLGKLIALLAELKPDVVHTQGAEANFHGIWAAKLTKVPRIVGEEIGIPNHHSFWKWVFRWIYKMAHLIIAVAGNVKQKIQELGEVEGEKVEVVYNPVCFEGKGKREKGIENSLSRIHREKEEKKMKFREEVERIEKIDEYFVFVTTCRLVPIKNLDSLIQAFGALVKENPDRKLLLRIVGDGPERENLEFRIQNLELGNQVEMFGFQSNIWPFLQESHAFVLPSLSEGSPVALAEAMSVGLLSIVTQVGGASEILGSSQSGILIDPLNTLEIQGAMQKILDLPNQERRAMGERAKEEAKRFSVENYISSLLDIYRTNLPLS
ncbi:glycosyltransferase [Algoriphagus sp. CAU 1675]|uniref:glycosyltransferase n=1 Tax=Algoriphagus sp. CAU 1675 TaxID=3032597 RepID=UPI0023DBB25B|nr:glycosyltransferase [Algoriphagus sp. CAU 1675]MDF2159398.1 glycosyltransferase [Algoriphagus sp. CAU 1675]